VTDVVIFTDQHRYTMDAGYGTNLFSMGRSIVYEDFNTQVGSAYIKMPLADIDPNATSDDKAAWARIKTLLNWQGYDWVRLVMEHNDYEKWEGSHPWAPAGKDWSRIDGTAASAVTHKNLDNYHRLIMLLLWARDNGVAVLLQQQDTAVHWNLPRLPLAGEPTATAGNSAPADINKMARGFARLVKALMVDGVWVQGRLERFPNIRWVNFTNEPDNWWGWFKGAKAAQGYQALNTALFSTQAGLGLNSPPHNLGLKIVGPERHQDTGAQRSTEHNMQEFLRNWDAVKPYVQGFEAHDYAESQAGAPWNWRPGTPTSSTQGRLSKRPFDDPNYPVLWGEFAGANNANFDWNITVARWYLGSVHNGIDGYARWSFMNQDDIDGKFAAIQTYLPGSSPTDPLGSRSPNHSRAHPQWCSQAPCDSGHPENHLLPYSFETCQGPDTPAPCPVPHPLYKVQDNNNDRKLRHHTDYQETTDLYWLDGLVNRLVPKWAQVHTLALEPGKTVPNTLITPAFFKSSNDNWTLAVVNENNGWYSQPHPAQASQVRYRFQGVRHSKRLYRYEIAADTHKGRHQPNRPGSPTAFEPGKAFDLAPGQTEFTDTIKPNSITLYSSYRLDAQAPGITEDGPFTQIPAAEADPQLRDLRDNTDASIQYGNRLTGQPGWRQQTQGEAQREHLGNSKTYSQTRGDYFAFSFYGTGFRLFGQQDASSGLASVYINGEHAGYASAYAPVTLTRRELFNSQTQKRLETGWHRVEVVLEGDKPLTGGTWFTFDALQTLTTP
jgi:hypothetical protein